MLNTEKTVLAVVVTYNGEYWIRKCLGSLQKSAYPIQTLVVDNGSTDTTIEIVKNEFPTCELVENHQNLGFGRANNIGLRKVLVQKYDFAFLLNQDAWIEEDTIASLVDTIEQDAQIGILSPLHFTGNGQKFDASFSRYIDQSLEFKNDCSSRSEIKEFYTIPFVNAAAWLIRRECLQKIGGFDPVFFHYGEDQNYCQRLGYHGFKIAFSPYAAIFHDRENRDATSIVPLLQSSNVFVDLCDITNNQPDLIDNYIAVRAKKSSNSVLKKQLELAVENYQKIQKSREQNRLVKANYLDINN